MLIFLLQELQEQIFHFNLLKIVIDWQDGILVERRLHRRKWKWDKHGAPMGQRLSSVTEVQQDELNDATSMFFTTTTGKVFEYQIPKYTGTAH